MNEKIKAKQAFTRTLEQMAGNALSFDDIRRAVSDALNPSKGTPTGPENFIYPEEVYPDFVIYHREGKYFKRSYSVLDGAVKLGDAETPVEQQWIDVQREALKEAMDDKIHLKGTLSAQVKPKPIPLTESEIKCIQSITETVSSPLAQAVVESENGVPVLKNVTIIRAGESKNKRKYSAEMLERDCVEAFEDAPAFVTNHNPLDKTLRNLAGSFKNVRFLNGEVKADLHGLASDAAILEKAAEAAQRMGPDRVGLSIDTMFIPVPKRGFGGIQEVQRLVRHSKTSVDIVMNPSAGGRLTECTEETLDMNVLQRLTEADLTKLNPASVKFITEGVSDDEIREANPALADRILKLRDTPEPAAVKVTEAQQAQSVTEATVETIRNLVTEQLRGELRGEIKEANRLTECRSLLAEKLNTAKLTDMGMEIVKAKFAGRAFEAEELDTEIKRVRDLAAKENPNLPRVPGAGGQAQVTENFDVNKARLESAISRKPVEINGQVVRPFPSISQAIFAFNPELRSLYADYPSQFAREALGYLHWEGGEAGYALARETITTGSFGYAWADVLYRQLTKEVQDPQLNSWRAIVSDFVNFKDLTVSHKMVSIGEIGTLATVPEGAAYPDLGEPTDRQQAISIAKKGGLFSITWEDVLRDDIGILARIPRNLGRAYAWTVYNAVFGLFQLNSGAGQTMDYDSTTLYHASHGNIATSAFSAANLETVRQKMVKQTDPGSSQRKMGYRAKFMLYETPELDQSAMETLMSQFKIPGAVTNAGEVNLPNYIRMLGLEPIPVMYPTATTTRWELVSNPDDAPTIAVGFLNGNETPELFIQDMETVGSMFTADKITYKVRGTVGAAAIEHRSFSRGNN